MSTLPAAASYFGNVLAKCNGSHAQLHERVRDGWVRIQHPVRFEIIDSQPTSRSSQTTKHENMGEPKARETLSCRLAYLFLAPSRREVMTQVVAGAFRVGSENVPREIAAERIRRDERRSGALAYRSTSSPRRRVVQQVVTVAVCVGLENVSRETAAERRHRASPGAVLARHTSRRPGPMWLWDWPDSASSRRKSKVIVWVDLEDSFFPTTGGGCQCGGLHETRTTGNTRALISTQQYKYRTACWAIRQVMKA